MYTPIVADTTDDSATATGIEYSLPVVQMSSAADPPNTMLHWNLISTFTSMANASKAAQKVQTQEPRWGPLLLPPNETAAISLPVAAASNQEQSTTPNTSVTAMTYILQPVGTTLDASEPMVGGFVVAMIDWRDFLSQIAEPATTVVLRDACGHDLTLTHTGHEAPLVSAGDLHDSKYNEQVYTVEVNHPMSYEDGCQVSTPEMKQHATSSLFQRPTRQTYFVE